MKKRTHLVYAAISVDDYKMPSDPRGIFGDRLFDPGLPYEEYFAVEQNSRIHREDFLIDFLVSLRTKGMYEDDIVLVVYHEFFSNKFYDAVNELKVSLVRKGALPVNSSYAVVQRFVDALDVIEHRDCDTVMMFDADVWFNRNIYELVDAMPDRGLLLAPSGPMKYFGHPKDVEGLRRYLAKISELYDASGCRGICASFVGGKREPVLQRLRAMRDSIDRGIYFKAWGLDQFLLTYLADAKSDTVSSRYCLSVYKNYFQAGDRDSSGVYSFHIHQNEENRFYYVHPEIIKAHRYERYYENSRQVHSAE